MFPATESADRGLLLATLPSIDTPHFLAPIITTAATAVRHHLIIVLFSRLFNNPSPRASTTFKGISRVDSWDDVLRLLTYVYVQATSIAQSLDKILMKIDVLLQGNDNDVPDAIAKGVDVVFRVSGDSIAVPLPISISSIRQTFLPSADHDPIELSISTPSLSTSPKSASPPSPTVSPIKPSINLPTPAFLPVVAIGGTFDHLHAGHKILLSMAAWITSERLIVGVTDDSLLQNKKHFSLVESLADRMSAVRGFLSLFRPGVTYDIVAIHDVYGPTAWDPDIQGLIVSHETMSGGDAIAAHRSWKGLPALKTFVIDVISHSDVRLNPEDMEVLRKTKISSTLIREWIFEKSRTDGE